MDVRSGDHSSWQDTRAQCAESPARGTPTELQNSGVSDTQLTDSQAPSGGKECEQQYVDDSNWNFHDHLPQSIGSHDVDSRQGTTEIGDIRLVGQSSRLLRPFLAEKGLTCQPDITPAHGFQLQRAGIASGLQQTVCARPARLLWISLPHMGTDTGSKHDRMRLSNVIKLAQAQLAMGDSYHVAIEGALRCNSWAYPPLRTFLQNPKLKAPVQFF